MGKKYIEFHLPNQYRLLTFVSILYCLNLILSESLEPRIKSKMSNSLFMFIGQSLAIIVYFYEKNLISKENEFKISYKSKYWILGIILCTFCDFLSNFRYDFYFYTFKMQNYQMKTPIEIVYLFFYFILIENIFLKISTFRHQYFGIILNSLGLFFSFIFSLYIIKKKKNKNENIEGPDSFFQLFLIWIISLETQYLKTIYYIIPKKLNTEYYINMNFICFIKGIFGTLISIIIIIFESNFSFLTDDNNMLYFLPIPLHIILFILISCILNIVILKVTEKLRPCYNLISLSLAQIIFDLIQKLFNKKKKKSNLIFLFPSFISFFGILLFYEIITINICNLNKYTKDTISKRGQIETLQDLNKSYEDAQ